MKTLKTLSILFFSLLILSCSKDDGDDEGSTDPEAEFTATINGGPYNNFVAKLGSYSSDSTYGLTIAVVDENGNTIRLFMNNTGGFSSGVTKEVGDVDGDGFQTSALFRDQATQIIYTANSGSLNIEKNNESNADPDNRVVSGTFNVTATINSGVTVTINGNFKNMVVSGL
ncbi:hypothetical protein [Aequorivita sp. CIP111184]|uniref:hypothetical protein n=1 Tax=Aequorivita sp. CIP111184 TaxID=2211356 RepID=UPI000DBBB997|nr:hypothetical protein [Aequorivita sp. CIP111184]SRX54874.1 hypothetical protein AEQU1_01894 [Aequorivita sp. CIP111184]